MLRRRVSSGQVLALASLSTTAASPRRHRDASGSTSRSQLGNERAHFHQRRARLRMPLVPLPTLSSHGLLGHRRPRRVRVYP